MSNNTFTKATNELVNYILQKEPKVLNAIVIGSTDKKYYYVKKNDHFNYLNFFIY